MNKIIEKKSRLDKLLANKNNWRILTDWLRTELAYTSNAIEGNTLTRRETAAAITEDITGGAKPIRDYIEAKNHATAFEFILDAIFKKSPVDENLILGIHRKILSGLDDENCGRYRNVRVRISGSSVILPNYIKVPELMHEFANWLKTYKSDIVYKAIMAHFRLVSIHPFIDGNGRTARLLMNMMLVRAGYSPIIIRKIDRKRYISAIEKFQLTGDGTGYEKFMMGALSKSMSMVIDLLNVDAPDTARLMTISKFAKLAGLPVSTIRWWVQTNKLNPAGYSENGYMLFNKSQIESVKKLNKK